MTELERKIIAVNKQLLPSGRAFRVAPGSDMEKMLRAFSITDADAWNAATSIKQSMFADNPGFTVDDATDWERRLGLVTNQLTPLADRMAAINRKRATRANRPRGHYKWLQKQLQDAGFTNLYVYENIPLTNPAVLNPAILSQSQHGDFQHSGVQSHYLNHIVIDSIYNSQDIGFDMGEDLSDCFFISAGPATPGTYANVLASREIELRQLILTVKQAHTAAVLFINYI